MKKILVLMAVCAAALSTETTKAHANTTTGIRANIAAGSARLVAGPPGASCSPGVTLQVSPDTRLDNLFQNYGNSGTGTSWTGGDGTVSVALPDGRELWFFDDSLLGTVTNGQRRFSTAAFLHNSLIVENSGSLTKTYFTSTTNAPGGATAFLSPRPRRVFKYGFWPTAAVVNGTTVQVLGTERLFAHGKKLGTEKPILGAYIATVGLPSLDPLGVQKLPFSVVGKDYIWGTLTQDGYVYIYLGSAKGIEVARVVGTDLRSPWTYYDGKGWAPKLSKAVAVVSNLIQVTAIGGIYLFIAANSLSNDIVAAVACSPVGPFGPSQAIYTTPEPSLYPTGYGVMVYDAKVHPELSTSPNILVASYDVNFWTNPEFDSNPDASVYRPRFVDITVNPG
jgi:hypothetical protein